MLDDPDPEAASAVDEMTIQAGHDNESVPDFDIPGSLNNSEGTVYFVWQRFGDNAYSNALTATLSAASGGAVISGAFDAAIFFLLQQRRFGRRVRA